MSDIGNYYSMDMYDHIPLTVLEHFSWDLTDSAFPYDKGNNDIN